MKRYLSYFLKGFLAPFKFIKNHVLTFKHWYSFIFWFALDGFFVYLSYTGTMKDPSQWYTVLVWGIAVGLHIGLICKLFKEWCLKHNGYKEYLIIDRDLQKAVDLIDEFDSEERLFENGVLQISTQIYNPKRYRCTITSEAFEELRSEDQTLTETDNTQQGDN